MPRPPAAGSSASSRTPPTSSWAARPPPRWRWRHEAQRLGPRDTAGGRRRRPRASPADRPGTGPPAHPGTRRHRPDRRRRPHLRRRPGSRRHAGGARDPGPPRLDGHLLHARFAGAPPPRDRPARRRRRPRDRRPRDDPPQPPDAHAAGHPAGPAVRGPRDHRRDRRPPAVVPAALRRVQCRDVLGRPRRPARAGALDGVGQGLVGGTAREDRGRGDAHPARPGHRPPARLRLHQPARLLALHRRGAAAAGGATADPRAGGAHARRPPGRAVLTAVLLAVAGAGAFAVATVVEHRTATHAAAAGEGWWLVRLTPRPAWLASQACGGLGVLLHAAALRSGPVSLVQPVLATGLVFALGLGSWVDRRQPGRPRPGRVQWLAAVAVAVGLTAFLLSARPPAGSATAPAGW